MSTKAQLFFAKLLIFFSIVIIFFGVYLQFNSNKVLDPEKDVTIISGDNGDISITPVDKDNVAVITENNDGNEEVSTPEVVVTPTPSVEAIPSAVPSASPSATPKPSSSSKPIVSTNPGNVSTPTPTPTPSPSPTPTPAPSPSPTPTIEETNAQLRSNLESAYGIRIRYGTETQGYSVGGMSTTIIPDSATCQIALQNLEASLALYPSGFFNEIANNGYSLTIYLIKRYSTANVTGVTDSSGKKVIISIAVDYPFADTLHHEVYHYIERYIFSKGFSFTSWSTLNPAGFTYGTVDATLSYSRTYSADAFFVNNYAQTDEYEDRASTFEYMMMPNKASCLNYGKPVWLKARTISEQIDYFLNSVSPNVTEYWERYL